MTTGQVNFQNVQETIRHNAEMEKIGQHELRIKQQEADTRTKSVSLDEMWMPYRQAETRAKIEHYAYEDAKIASDMAGSWIDRIFGSAERAKESVNKRISQLLFKL